MARIDETIRVWGPDGLSTGIGTGVSGMAGEIIITVIGNITADPEIKHISSGAAVANFSVASTPRVFDKASGEWQDGETVFLRCNLWRQPAENLAESNVTTGTRVIVSGRLRQRSYEKDGEKRSVMELEVDEIGVSLKFATVHGVTKATRSNGASSSSGGGQTQKATASNSGGFCEEPPF